MTDTQIRVAIAEACGWRFHPDGCGYVPPGGNEWIGRGYKSLAECVPDYLNDLNAMHEAERKLSLDQRDTYWIWLARLTEKGRMATAAWLTTTATARQRAEAFLRTLGKWIE